MIPLPLCRYTHKNPSYMQWFSPHYCLPGLYMAVLFLCYLLMLYIYKTHAYTHHAWYFKWTRKKKLYENIVKSARINEYLIYTTRSLCVSRMCLSTEMYVHVKWKSKWNESILHRNIHTHTQTHTVWYRNARVLLYSLFYVCLFIRIFTLFFVFCHKIWTFIHLLTVCSCYTSLYI